MPTDKNSRPGDDWRTSGYHYDADRPFSPDIDVDCADSLHQSHAHDDRACPKCHMIWARARELAEERQAELEAESWPMPSDACAPLNLALDLSMPQERRRWLADRLIGADHNVIVSALYKAGKTTLAVNLAAHLAAGEPFLGRETRGDWSGDVSVSYWNLEVSRDDFKEEYARGLDMPGGVCSWWDGRPAATVPQCPAWKDPGFLDSECCQECPGDWRTWVRVAHLRNFPVPLLDGAGAREWAMNQLRGCRVWVIDTWGRFCAWHGVDPVDNAGVSDLLARLDEFKAEAGIGCVIFTAHTPHAARVDRTQERAMGAQSFSAWADALVSLTINEAGERFVSASGRGVSMAETRIEFAPGTTRLVTAGGSRADADDFRLRFQLLKLIGSQPGIGAKALRDACGGAVGKTDQAVAALVKDGQVVKITGRNGQAAKHYVKGAEP